MAEQAHDFSREIADAKRIFDKYDTDKSGFLEEAEVVKVLEETYAKIGVNRHINASEVKSYIHSLDKNGDNKVSNEEFTALMIQNLKKIRATTPQNTSGNYSEGGYQKPPLVKSELDKSREVFDRFDKDKSGFLEENEIPEVLNETFKALGVKKEVTAEDVKRYMRTFDKNWDKKISFDEFSKLIQHEKSASS